MRITLILTMACAPSISGAETIFAMETLRARDILTEENVQAKDTHVPGGATALHEVIGKELVHAVYAGRPIMIDNLKAPALVERNQIVVATYSSNGLTITTEARALERGALGDTITAMNMTSKTKIRAKVLDDGNLGVLP